MTEYCNSNSLPSNKTGETNNMMMMLSNDNVNITDRTDLNTGF